MITGVSTNYDGRQVDVELLQSVVTVSAAEIPMSLSTVGKTPKLVTGVQKAIQRYVYLLLLEAGSSKFAPTLGTSFMPSFISGYITNKGALMRTFALANFTVLNQLRISNSDVATYGSIPDDEVITKVELNDIQFVYATGTVKFSLTFTFASGANTEFVLPVTMVR